MSSHKPLTLQSSREYASLFPCSPVSNSFATQWQGISLVHMRLPAQKLPEVCMPLHGVGIFTTSNAVERTIDGTTKNYSQIAGDIVVTPSHAAHGCCWIDEAETISIGLDPSLFTYINDDAMHLKQNEIVPHFGRPDPLVYQIGLSLKSVLEKDPMGSRLYAETTAAMLAVHLLQHYGQRKLEFKDYADGLPRSTLHHVIEYIQANLDRDLGLAELAAIARLSPHYFARLFKRSTGHTPHQFVLRCRVERAKSLLLNGKDEIAEIAQQVGFANQAHLNVHIKRSLGVTPKIIRAQNKRYGWQQTNDCEEKSPLQSKSIQ